MANRWERPKQIFSSVPLWFTLNVLLFVGLLIFHFLPLAKPNWWADAFAVTANIVAGGLVSFFFYWLVVHVPEQRKRSVIKNNLTRMYRDIKEDILYQVVFASRKGGRDDLQADPETIERLMQPNGFKAAFQGGREAYEGFYAFENQMSEDTPEFRAIIMYLEMLAKQIEFVLHNYTMDKKELFDFFKRLELMLLSLHQSTPGYDESKPLCRFVYEVFAGFSFVEGYRGYDIIEKMITDI
jgi:hypothetical protein